MISLFSLESACLGARRGGHHFLGTIWDCAAYLSFFSPTKQGSKDLRPEDVFGLSQKFRGRRREAARMLIKKFREIQSATRLLVAYIVEEMGVDRYS
jgi:hypothetical protein